VATSAGLFSRISADPISGLCRSKSIVHSRSADIPTSAHPSLALNPDDTLAGIWTPFRRGRLSVDWRRLCCPISSEGKTTTGSWMSVTVRAILSSVRPTARQRLDSRLSAEVAGIPFTADFKGARQRGHRLEGVGRNLGDVLNGRVPCGKTRQCSTKSSRSNRWPLAAEGLERPCRFKVGDPSRQGGCPANRTDTIGRPGGSSKIARMCEAPKAGIGQAAG